MVLVVVSTPIQFCRGMFAVRGVALLYFNLLDVDLMDGGLLY